MRRPTLSFGGAIAALAVLASPLAAQEPLVLRPGDALRIQVQEEATWSGNFEFRPADLRANAERFSEAAFREGISRQVKQLLGMR